MVVPRVPAIPVPGDAGQLIHPEASPHASGREALGAIARVLEGHDVRIAVVVGPNGMGAEMADPALIRCGQAAFINHGLPYDLVAHRQPPAELE